MCEHVFEMSDDGMDGQGWLEWAQLWMKPAPLAAPAFPWPEDVLWMWSILHAIYAVKIQATKWFNTSEGLGIEVELHLTKFCFSADVCTLDTAGAKQIGNPSILFNHVMIVIYEGALSNLLQLRRRNTRMFSFLFRHASYCFFIFIFFCSHSP